MINRVLIRIKVVQMVYSYLLTKDGMKMSEALKTLSQSMDNLMNCTTISLYCRLR